MIRIRLLPIFAALAVSLLASSCDDYGIMASIQKQTDQTASLVLANTPVSQMAGTTAYYYVKLNAAYTRPVSGGTWTVFGKDQFGSGFECRGLAGSGTTVFIAARKSDGSYVVESYTDAGTWATLNTTAMAATEQIQGLFLTNSMLFMSTSDASGKNYKLYVSDVSGAPTAFAASTFSSSLAGTEYIVGVSSLTAGPIYFVATSLAIYSSPAATPLGAYTATTVSLTSFPATSNTIDAICGDGGSNIYSADSAGQVVKYAGAPTTPVATGKSVTALAWIAAPTSQLMVGFGATSTNFGYDLVPAAFTTASLISGGSVSDPLMGNGSIYTTTLGALSVNCLYVDSSNNVFAGVAASGSTTAYSGLYQTASTGVGAWASGWKAE